MRQPKGVRFVIYIVVIDEFPPWDKPKKDDEVSGSDHDSGLD